MSTYSISKQLPSCKVPRKLLEELEDYLNTLSKLLPRPEADCKLDITREVIIKDSVGKEVLQSIKAFDRTNFPNDTESIQITYTATSLNRLSVQIKFHKFRQFSELEISFNGSSSREVVSGISTEILNRVSHYQNLNHFIQTAGVAAGSLWAIAFGLVLQAISDREPLFNDKRLSQLIGIILMVLGAGMLSLIRLKPYTTFETRWSEAIDRKINWIILALLGFILFSVVGVYFRQRIFGF